MIRRMLSATISPKARPKSRKRASLAVETTSFSSSSSSSPKKDLTSQQLSMLIRRASEEGDANEVKTLLQRDGATAKAHTRPGNTTARTSLLLSFHPLSKLSYLTTHSHKNTTVHCAAFRGHYEVCRILLNQGADPNATDDFERTALHRAARKGHKQVLRLLIDRGSDVLMYDSNGLLASDLAAKKMFDPSITKLLKEAEINARMPRVPPPLPSHSNPPSRTLFYASQLVKAQWYDERTGTWDDVWYPARIVKSHKNGYYEVDYKDGYRAMNVPVEKIQSIIWHNMVDKLEKEKMELTKSLDELKISSMKLEKKLGDVTQKYESSKKDIHDLSVALDKSQEKRIVAFEKRER